MAANSAVGSDFCLRGKRTQLRQQPKAPTNSDLTLMSPVSNVLKARDPTSETNFRHRVESPPVEAAVAGPADAGAASVPPAARDRWFLSPRHLRASEYPVDRLDGLPTRRVTVDERREGLLGGLLASSDISRDAALAPGPADKPLGDGAQARQRVRPVDYDPLAAVHFPVTLGASYRVREQIEAAADGSAGASLTFSPPGSGLPYPTDPWRVRTPHNAGDFVPQFRSVGDHLADAVPQARRRREVLLADRAPATAAAEVFVSSPFSVDLAQLRMQRLRIEEEILLEVKRQQELERTAPPKSRWYELSTPQFHYEAHKNNQLVRGSAEYPLFDAELYQYRQQLMDKSAEFKETFDAYARQRSMPS